MTTTSRLCHTCGASVPPDSPQESSGACLLEMPLGSDEPGAGGADPGRSSAASMDFGDYELLEQGYMALEQALLVFNFGSGLIFGDNWDLNLTGTYTVNGNGTGTMNLPGGHRLHFVIGAGGNELKYIGTVASEVTAGSMVKQ